MTAQPRLLGGRYEIGGVLGYGGMAEVHRGRDLRLGRDVAIKMLRTDLARDETFLTRFRREAQNAASLNHPSIVAVYDTGEDSGNGSVPYIVMEYVEGRTLKEVLIAEGRLAPRRACEIVADVCAALDFSHRHQIIHRDVKPGNVMLATNGQVKVMDFGIARAMAAGQATMTQTSAVIGTAQYLSPEQARGETVDRRSDVYATGCLLYELLCGDPPFTGDNPVSVAYQHVREAPKTPSSVNPDVPPSVDAIVLKALAKNAANRYQTAGEMREDLERAIAGRPVLATPLMGEEERTQLLGAATGDDTRHVPAAVEAPRRNRKRVVALWTVLALLLAGAVGYGAWYMAAGNRVEVPTVIGETQADAETMIREAGLEPEVDMVPSTEEEAGLVLDQSPPGAASVVEGSAVTIEVGAGPTMVEVPDLSGAQTQQEVIDLLAEVDLSPKFEEVDGVEPGFVSQDPEAGEQVEPNGKVTVKWSDGNLNVVPNVVGQNEDDACGQLSSAGFGCNREYVTGNQPVGTVLEQNPGGGQELEGGDVTIRVVGVSVPNLDGKTIDQARAEMPDGLQLEVPADAEGDWVINGQDPAPDTVVQGGSTVTVTAEDPGPIG
ncbi:serine/threonine-protein kinase [Stackebrandtia albiflava]|uniref:non-specific serine/threonine protein kinase n=1 Tax=Stackebrandtia albiflava TaxID=406432 RepID=A0A562V0V3_9ACTN|nr:Stk1 family PASTA domain-containing Ser/Thr kinase [Stackebrandtia albiflava]TWJ11529.1 serine/threonine-protein kinase [Stackebrandtia albiflava]